jgi:hypothetical protein
LVAFPAKDNYEGVLYPLDWVGKVGLAAALVSWLAKLRA